MKHALEGVSIDWGKLGADLSKLTPEEQADFINGFALWFLHINATQEARAAAARAIWANLAECSFDLLLWANHTVNEGRKRQ